MKSCSIHVHGSVASAMQVALHVVCQKQFFKDDSFVGLLSCIKLRPSECVGFYRNLENWNL